MGTEKIRIKAMCLLIHDNRVLVADANTLLSKGNGRKRVPGNFYRTLGGGVHFNETAEDAIRREIREELQSEIENLARVDVVENLYVYAGEKRHDIVFLFVGQIAKIELCSQETIHIVEDEYEVDAKWISLDVLINGDVPLYPTLNYKTIFQKILS